MTRKDRRMLKTVIIIMDNKLMRASGNAISGFGDIKKYSKR
jgi:hypothetical protein